MISLNSQPENGPLMRIRYLFNDLLEPIMHRAYQHLAPALWTPNDMVDNQVGCMLFMLIVHVATLAQSNGFSKNVLSPHPSSQ
jgi:hypothetical protein